MKDKTLLTQWEKEQIIIEKMEAFVKKLEKEYQVHVVYNVDDVKDRRVKKK